MASAPNILLVMSDQHRADMLGCAGDASMHTPTLDRLAAEGVRFSRVSCQGPLCMPSRASFMTERYVRDHGVYTNWEEIPQDSPTYAKALREAGYHTSLLGKAHLYRDEIITVDHIDDMAPRLRRLGFAEVFETGDKFMGKMPSRYTDFLATQGLLDTYRQHIADRSYQGENEDGRNATKSVPMWDATPMPLPLSAYVDTWHGTEAVRWLEEYDRPEPFFLFVGFPGPHDPWDAPAEAVARYRDVDISMPASTTRPTLEGTGRYEHLLNAFLGLADTLTMSEDAIRGMRRAYAADISVIDHAVGLMLDALERKGLPGQHLGRLHDRPRRDGRQPRAHVQVRPLRAGGAGAPDHPAPGRVRPAGRRLAGRAARRPRHRAGHGRRPRPARRARAAPSSSACATARPAPPARSRSARTGASPASRPSATSWWSTRTPWRRASSSTWPRTRPRTTTCWPTPPRPPWSTS